MKKLIIGLAGLALVLVPSVSLASGGYPANSMGQLVGGDSCSTVVGNDGKVYPDICDVSIYKYTNSGNTCYITSKGSISCVRGN